MANIQARPNGRFTTFILILAPLTLGIGSVALWFWHRSFVKSIDESGITLVSGRRVPWNKVLSFHSRKNHSSNDGERKVTRLDIQLEEGHALILPNWLENGEEMIEAIKIGAREAMPADARMRVQYTQRR
ncbi:hypothetical protein MKI84_14600 [Ancylobacter sp. A5.8]|uniref:hypothetical protein n=1 Tax=Ancylobacter gelatini TaxID=2919920 RepID=UPI001F4D4852|nr:hypothetical protein [Ancylobacter gelatini]MCJ8144148.1 hypothetical protein [Ancylobacter gelatini]